MAHIIESFKKEKFAFNERFSELKKRLDTLNNKRGAEIGGRHMYKTAGTSTSGDKAYNPMMHN